MAYVDGGTLGRRVRQRGPLPHDAAARLLEEVARALAYAHDRGVVHRDIKPDNILLDLATGRALVSDFGIARVGSDTTTGPQRVVGTAEFMSPEQVLGERVDPRDRKSTRLNSSHSQISYAVFCLKKKKNQSNNLPRLQHYHGVTL